MDSSQIEILFYIASRQSVLWYDVLNAFDPDSRINEISRILQGFLHDRLIEKVNPAEKPPRCRIRLTSSGWALIQAAKPSAAQSLNDSEQLARDRKQHKRDKLKAFAKGFTVVVAVLSGLATILGFILGFL